MYHIIYMYIGLYYISAVNTYMYCTEHRPATPSTRLNRPSTYSNVCPGCIARVSAHVVVHAEKGEVEAFSGT